MKLLKLSIIAFVLSASVANAQSFTSLGKQSLSSTNCTTPTLIAGYGSLVADVDVTGAFTVIGQGRIPSDGTWHTITLIDDTDTTPTAAASMTADGKYRFNIAGYRHFRLCGSAGAGSAIVSFGAAATGGGSGSGGGSGVSSGDLLGSCTPDSLLLAATVNETQLATGAAYLHWANGVQIGTDVVWVHLYDGLMADIDETDLPDYTVMIPVNSTAANGAGNNPPASPVGMAFATGIVMRTVKGIARNSTTAVDASEVVVNWCISQ